MGKKNDEELVKVHLTLYKSDYEWYQRIFGENQSVSLVIRRILRSYRKSTEEQADAKQ